MTTLEPLRNSVARRRKFNCESTSLNSGKGRWCASKAPLTTRQICWCPINVADASRNVAVFGFAWSKTATKPDKEQGVWPFLATVRLIVARKYNVFMLAKPKTTTIRVSWSFLTSFPDSGCVCCHNLQRNVAKKSNAIDQDLALRPFWATYGCGCRWLRALVVSKRLAARYDSVLRAYGAPSVVEPCPAGPAGRFAPPPGIWRP